MVRAGATVIAARMVAGCSWFVMSVVARIIMSMSRAFRPYSLYHRVRAMSAQFLFCFRNSFETLKGPHIEA